MSEMSHLAPEWAEATGLILESPSAFLTLRCPRLSLTHHRPHVQEHGIVSFVDVGLDQWHAQQILNILYLHNVAAGQPPNLQHVQKESITTISLSKIGTNPPLPRTSGLCTWISSWPSWVVRQPEQRARLAQWVQKKLQPVTLLLALPSLVGCSGHASKNLVSSSVRSHTGGARSASDRAISFRLTIAAPPAWWMESTVTMVNKHLMADWLCT